MARAARTVTIAAGVWETSWNSSHAGTPLAVSILLPANTMRALYTISSTVRPSSAPFSPMMANKRPTMMSRLELRSCDHSVTECSSHTSWARSVSSSFRRALRHRSLLNSSERAGMSLVTMAFQTPK